MIDWIDRIPDSMVGVLAASAAWFTFNYAVLAPRAMERQHVEASIPSCMDALERRQQRMRIPSLGLSEILGLPPELRALEGRMTDLMTPRPLSFAERQERCACAARRAAAAVRFDYAIHTASFRIIEPQAIAGLSDATFGATVSGICGVIPEMLRSR
ncbi:hypothetical protein HB662_28010 [Roseomonas frigidaquae]|uniref:Uncharacterized protein n=1 Tax=Falsiroseomonas frigidaquae TaxID=487318 RepID=A0ABX1F8U5_9PROT|nr:hypothetical protein [Falsiroseomonas frigidaquae]NKE48644.1 hypothetical protein [Falsiroseomonas frigidaquae]